MTAPRIADIAPAARTSRAIAEMYERATPSNESRPPTRAEAIAWIEAIERFYADPLPERLTSGLREAFSASVTAAQWRESIGGTEIVIAALRDAIAMVDGSVTVTAEAILGVIHPDLAERARRARVGARARIAERLEAVEHLRDRTLVRIAQIEGRTDEEAIARLRQRAVDAMARADAKQSPISDDEAAALARAARRAG